MNIAIIGYGKMGREVEKTALKRNHSIVLIVDEDNQKDFTFPNLQKADVAIEFTQPETAYENYLKCFAANVPVVSGTTGWLDKMEDIKNRCKNEGKGFFYASNFSLGVNLFFKAHKTLAKLMSKFPDYGVEIEETHHIHKLDAPSGTAITLAEAIMDVDENKKNWVNNVTNQPKSIPIISKREGIVPGIHFVKYASENDEITIRHSANNRVGFALGAVLAAEFMKKKAGFYGMNDLLKL